MTPTCHCTDIAIYVITHAAHIHTYTFAAWPAKHITKQSRSAPAPPALPQHTELVIIFYLIFITCATCRKLKRIDALHPAKSSNSSTRNAFVVVTRTAGGAFIGYRFDHTCTGLANRSLSLCLSIAYAAEKS